MSTQLKTLLDEDEMARRGALLAEVLHLERDDAHKDRWQTEWGTKTALGLFRTVERIMEDGKRPSAP